VAVSMTV